MRPTKTQISLHVCAFRSDSFLSAWRNFASLAIQNVPNEDSDQNAKLHRLIWIFAECTYLKVCFQVYALNWTVLILKLAWWVKILAEDIFKYFSYVSQKIGMILYGNCLPARQFHGMSNPIFWKKKNINLYSAEVGNCEIYCQTPGTKWTLTSLPKFLTWLGVGLPNWTSQVFRQLMKYCKNNDFEHTTCFVIIFYLSIHSEQHTICYGYFDWLGTHKGAIEQSSKFHLAFEDFSPTNMYILIFL